MYRFNETARAGVLSSQNSKLIVLCAAAVFNEYYATLMPRCPPCLCQINVTSIIYKKNKDAEFVSLCIIYL